MSKEIRQDKLEQLRYAVKGQWGALTDEDLDTVDEKLVQLPGLLQSKYGHTREEAETEIQQFLSNLKTEGADKVEVVREAFSDSTPEEEAHVKKSVYKE